MDKEVVVDTSAILTLFSANNLEGNIKLSKIHLLAPICVKEELREFKEHKDFLGRKAADSLKEVEFKENPLSQEELKEEKDELGIKEGISSCDIQTFHLSVKKDKAFFTDDFNAHYHFSTHYPDKEIFFGILLVCEALDEDKEKIFNFIFEDLIPKRWPKISDRNLVNLKVAITEYLK